MAVPRGADWSGPANAVGAPGERGPAVGSVAWTASKFVISLRLSFFCSLRYHLSSAIRSLHILLSVFSVFFAVILFPRCQKQHKFNDCEWLQPLRSCFHMSSLPRGGTQRFCALFSTRCGPSRYSLSLPGVTHRANLAGFAACVLCGTDTDVHSSFYEYTFSSVKEEVVEMLLLK